MNTNYFLFLVKVSIIVLLVTIKNFFGTKGEILSRDYETFITTGIFLLVTSVLIQIVLQAYRRRRKISFNRSDNFIAGVNNSYVILIFVSILYAGLKFMGISINQFFTSISIVAAAIVILTKEYLSDVISGFIISFSDILSIDDSVNIDEHRGVVKDISLTKTHILTQDEELLILPNSKIFFGQIVNYTKGNKRRVAIPFDMDIKALDSVDALEFELTQELETFIDQIEPNSYVLRIENIAKDSVSFKFLYTISKIDSKLESAIRRKTVRKIVDYIKNKSAHQKE